MSSNTNQTRSELTTIINNGFCHVKDNATQPDSGKVRAIIELSTICPSMFLNTIVVLAVCYIKRLHTTPNFFIASLAGSDVVFVCVNSACFIAGLQYTDKDDTRTPILDCIESFLTMSSLFNIHFSHLIISGERWLYIARPYLHQRIVTRRSSAYVIITAWVIACTASARLLIDCDRSGSSERVDMGIVDPCVHFLLNVAMFSIYGHIAAITQRQIRTIKTLTYASDPKVLNETEKTLSSLRTTWRTVRMLVTVSGTYFLFLTPHVCMNIYMHATCDYRMRGNVLKQCMRVLAFLHNYCTFFVYARQDKDFRHALEKCWARLGCHRCQRQVTPAKY